MTVLTVRLDFNALAHGFSARVSAVLERAAFLLHAMESAEQNPGYLPNTTGPVQVPTRPLEDLKAETRLKILGDALEDADRAEPQHFQRVFAPRRSDA